MRIWVDREFCQRDLADCLSCFSQLTRTGTTECDCIQSYTQDGKKSITIFGYYRGQDWKPFIIAQELLDMIAYEYRDGVLAPKIKIEF
jgi:hypothetical protein